MSELIPNTEVYSLPPGTPSDSASPREPIRLILIGSPHGISLITNHLYSLGFAEPRAWSKSQIDPASGKSMRILTKWIRQ